MGNSFQKDIQMIIQLRNFALDDSFFKRRLSKIISDYSIKTVVETGINEGKSTAVLATMVASVIGVDYDIDCIRSTEKIVNGMTNVRLLLGNSPDVLQDLVPTLPDETVFFLDAHWDDYWPLLDEIGKLQPGVGIIILHDVQVPGKNFGFDTYKGTILNYEYVKEALFAWSPTHRIEYNSEADGSYRGIMYIFPN